MILHLDFSGETPIYQQIRDEIVLGIAAGRLLPGERLPTIRALAGDAGINMMTANKAYQLLKQEGYIITDRRNGATVACAHAALPLCERTRHGLLLAASEAKLTGMDKDAFLTLCGQYYEDGGSGA